MGPEEARKWAILTLRFFEPTKTRVSSVWTFRRRDSHNCPASKGNGDFFIPGMEDA